MTYKTDDMFSTCVVFDEYPHIENSSQNEIGCVGKGCFSAFEQDINHAIILFFDGDINQSLKGMHVSSFVADISRTQFLPLIFVLIAWNRGNNVLASYQLLSTTISRLKTTSITS